MTSSHNNPVFEIQTNDKEQTQFSFEKEYETFGNQDLDATLQNLLAFAHATVPKEPKNDLHVQNNLIEELIKENQLADIDCANVAKKLAFSPSPSSFKRKKPSTPRVKRSENQLRTPSSRCKAYKFDLTKTTLPKYARCKFPPTKNMRLFPEEAIVCLLFPENLGEEEHSPTVFKIGDNCCGLRSDFQSMIPDSWVGDNIITMMAMSITRYQRYNAYNKEVWTLPPSFALRVSISSHMVKCKSRFHKYFKNCVYS
ncbi:hypothetical protein P8452_32396 [Trifolium repens]|nr:hypothetical protein P8452_32396 [Trifolium repens]